MDIYRTIDKVYPLAYCTRCLQGVYPIRPVGAGKQYRLLFVAIFLRRGCLLFFYIPSVVLCPLSYPGNGSGTGFEPAHGDKSHCKTAYRKQLRLHCHASEASSMDFYRVFLSGIMLMIMLFKHRPPVNSSPPPDGGNR